MLKFGVINFLFAALLLALLVFDYAVNVSIWWYVVLMLMYSLIQAYGSAVLSAQFFVPVKYKGSSTSQAIAITFDDGPISGKTEKILDILKAHDIKAAFFCVGYRIHDNPQLVQRIHAEGHIVANHSYWHSKTFDLQWGSKIADELRQTDREIQKNIGFKPRYFRPPYGVTNPMVASAVKSLGYTTIGWSLRSFDTMYENSAALLKRVMSLVKGGDVILFHDYCDSTIEILPTVLMNIKKLGLKIVRVDDLLNEKPYV